MLPSVHITIPWWASTQDTAQVQGTTPTWIPSFCSQISGRGEWQLCRSAAFLKALFFGMFGFCIVAGKKTPHDTGKLVLPGCRQGPLKLQVHKIFYHTYREDSHEKTMLIFSWFNRRRNPWVISLVTVRSPPRDLRFWMTTWYVDC